MSCIQKITIIMPDFFRTVKNDFRIDKDCFYHILDGF